VDWSLSLAEFDRGPGKARVDHDPTLIVARPILVWLLVVVRAAVAGRPPSLPFHYSVSHNFNEDRLEPTLEQMSHLILLPVDPIRCLKTVMQQRVGG